LKYDSELSLKFIDEVEKPVCGLVTMPLKDRDRAIQKAFEDYEGLEPGPGVVYLNDVVRASIICVTEDQITGVLKAVYTTPNLAVISVKNRFKSQCPNGYRDILITAYVNFIVENQEDDDDEKGYGAGGKGCGFVCELQVLTHSYSLTHSYLLLLTYSLTHLLDSPLRYLLRGTSPENISIL